MPLAHIFVELFSCCWHSFWRIFVFGIVDQPIYCNTEHVTRLYISVLISWPDWTHTHAHSPWNGNGFFPPEQVCKVIDWKDTKNLISSRMYLYIVYALHNIKATALIRSFCAILDISSVYHWKKCIGAERCCNMWTANVETYCIINFKWIFVHFGWSENQSLLIWESCNFLYYWGFFGLFLLSSIGSWGRWFG